MASLLIIGGSLAAAGGLGATLFGFGTAGVVAGSAAAATQAAIGNVAAHSLFATLTSWGMLGVFSFSSILGPVIFSIGLLALIFNRNEENKYKKSFNGVISNCTPYVNQSREKLVSFFVSAKKKLKTWFLVIINNKFP